MIIISTTMLMSIIRFGIKLYLSYGGASIITEYLFKKAYEKKYLKQDHESFILNSIANIIIQTILTIAGLIVLKID